MASKLYDLTVKVGEYEKDGETKNRYENIGAVMENNDGGQFILMKRTFNPAGVVPKNPTDDRILIACFEPREEERPARQQSRQSAPPPRTEQPRPAPRRDDPFPDDDIPF